MSWCPKCKQEFQDGITICPTCDETLVDELDPTVIMKEIDFFSEEEVSKFSSFLSYSNITGTTWEKDEILGLYRIRCKEENFQEVLKLFQAFKSVEEETNEETELAEEESKDFEESDYGHNTDTYVKKKDKYSDIHSTGIMLVGIAAVGFIYILLNSSGILHLLNGYISYGLNIALFAASMIYGIYSLKQASNMKSQIAEEEALIQEIMNWLNEAVTETLLETFTDLSLPKEANFLKQAQGIKRLAQNQFPDAPENLLESLIDEKMNEE